mgnify:CR=1 FL=1
MNSLLTTFSIGTMATSVRNFSSHDRGVVVGIAKGAFAVSTGFVAQLYIGMYKPDALHFLLFLAFFSPCVIFVCIPFLRLVPSEERDSSSSSSSCGLIITSILILFNGSWLVLVVMLQQMSESKNIKLMSLYTCIVFTSMILCVSPCIQCCRTPKNRRRGRRAIELTKNSILKVIRRRNSQKYERVSLGTWFVSLLMSHQNVNCITHLHHKKITSNTLEHRYSIIIITIITFIDA